MKIEKLKNKRTIFIITIFTILGFLIFKPFSLKNAFIFFSLKGHVITYCSAESEYVARATGNIELDYSKEQCINTFYNKLIEEIKASCEARFQIIGRQAVRECMGNLAFAKMSEIYNDEVPFLKVNKYNYYERRYGIVNEGFNYE